MELRIHGERAVLVAGARPDDPQRAGSAELDEAEPDEAELDEELAAALDEWARVAAAVGDGKRRHDSKVATMVSRRGRQLAGRVAEAFDAPVRYSDPVSGTSTVVRPGRRGKPSVAERLIGTQARPGDPVPWLTGTIVAVFTGVVIAIAMLALASTLATRVSAWMAILATIVVSAGIVPSLWLGRGQLIARWAALGAACGLAFSWLGVLVLVF